MPRRHTGVRWQLHESGPPVEGGSQTTVRIGGSPEVDAWEPVHDLGVGTGGRNGETTARVVARALDVGYRHVDTAEQYGNERAVGDAIGASEVPRDDVVIATKIHSANLEYDDVLTHVEASRERLGVDRLDVVYIHWPAHAYDPTETFRGFAHLRDIGRLERVGICNVTTAVLDEARRQSPVPIEWLQVELHPLLQQEDLVAYATRHGLRLFAHTPFAQGVALDLPEITDIATRHGWTAAQVCLAWLLEKDQVGAIPGASVGNLEENFDARELSLDRVDVERIDAIERTERFVDYAFAPWNR